MKKILLLLLLSLSVCTLQAQNTKVGSNSSSITTVRERTRERAATESTSFVRIGLNLGTMSEFDEFDFDEDMRQMGYYVGCGFNKTLPAISGLYWGMEVALTTRGYSGRDEYSNGRYYYGTEYYDEKEYKDTYIAHSFMAIPYNMGYKYQIPSTGIKVDFHLGLYLSYDYAGRVYETTEYFSSEYDISDKDKETYTIKEAWDDDYCRYDVGLNFGFGVWFNRLNLDVSFQRGYIPMVEYWLDYNENLGKTRNITIKLGYAL